MLNFTVAYRFSIENRWMKSMLSEPLMHAECTDYADFIRQKKMIRLYKTNGDLVSETEFFQKIRFLKMLRKFSF